MGDPAHAAGHTGYDSAGGWIQIHRAGAWLTTEQVAAFVEEYEALLSEYLPEPGVRPPDTRRMAVRLVVLPDEGSHDALLTELDEDGRDVDAGPGTTVPE